VSLELLTVAQVAELFGVAPRTVTRWVRSGRLSAIRTLGGHHRFFADEVLHLLEGVPLEARESGVEAVVLPFPAERLRSRLRRGYEA
jgi:excisionase family DNA binding protein